MQPEAEAHKILMTYWEGEVPVDVYKLARKILVQVNEVQFKDDCLYTYCDATRVIEVSKDLSDAAKRWIVANCLSKFIYNT